MENSVNPTPLSGTFSLFLPKNAIRTLGGDAAALRSDLLPRPINLYEVADVGQEARFVGVTG